MSDLLKLRDIAASAKVNVYRDGDVVTLVACGSAQRETADGPVTASLSGSLQYPTVEAFEADRDQLRSVVTSHRRLALLIPKAQKVAAKLGITGDARTAPPLPPELRYLLRPALPRQETPGRPFLTR